LYYDTFAPLRHAAAAAAISLYFTPLIAMLLPFTPLMPPALLPPILLFAAADAAYAITPPYAYAADFRR